MLPKQLLTVAALFAAALFILDVPAAYARNIESSGSGSGDWDDTSSWTDTKTGQAPTSKPNAGDFVTIKNGHDIDVDTSPECADHITVETGAQLDIAANCTLTLDGSGSTTSTVDGAINLEAAGSKLAFTANSQTLTGSGNIDGCDSSATIEIADGLTLTSDITIEGELQIFGTAGGNTTRFINDTGGLVRANRVGTLDLNVDALDDGTNCSDGDWVVSSANAAILEFSVGSILLSGDFTVNVSHANGTLWIQANVATEGDLIFSDGKIQVDSGCYFKVNQTGLCN